MATGEAQAHRMLYANLDSDQQAVKVGGGPDGDTAHRRDLMHCSGYHDDYDYA